MDANQRPVDIDYDAEHDVLRVFVCPPSADAIAIPGPSGVTVLVSESLDRIYGLVFENYVASIPQGREAGDSPARREETFRESVDWLVGVLPGVIETFAPVAKDRAASWLEQR